MPLQTDRARLVVSVAITAIACGVGTAHAIWPGITIDGVTAVLVAIAISPWLGYVFKAVELPGLGRVEYPDLERAEAELTKAGLVTPQVRITEPPPLSAESDPLIALAGLRIELERKLRHLAKVNGVKIAGRPGSIRMLARELGSGGVISEQEASALADMGDTLNRAVHAQPVREDAADWVFTVGPSVLASLDRKVSAVAASASRT